MPKELCQGSRRGDPKEAVSKWTGAAGSFNEAPAAEASRPSREKAVFIGNGHHTLIIWRRAKDVHVEVTLVLLFWLACALCALVSVFTWTLLHTSTDPTWPLGSCGRGAVTPPSVVFFTVDLYPWCSWLRALLLLYFR